MLRDASLGLTVFLMCSTLSLRATAEPWTARRGVVEGGVRYGLHANGRPNVWGPGGGGGLSLTMPNGLTIGATADYLIGEKNTGLFPVSLLLGFDVGAGPIVFRATAGPGVGHVDGAKNALLMVGGCAVLFPVGNFTVSAGARYQAVGALQVLTGVILGLNIGYAMQLIPHRRPPAA